MPIRQRIATDKVVLVVVLLVATILRFWRLGSLSLVGDESYYWLWSHHLDWSYFDHPAGVALLIRLSTALGGQGEVGVRWLNAALGVASVYLAYRLGAQMFSRRTGLFAATVLAAGAPFTVISRFVYTDGLQLAVMLLSLLCFWQLVQGELRWSTGLALGLSLAVLLNTKYNAYLLVAALVTMVLLEHRRLLSSGWAWLGASIGLAGLVPVIMWNAAHEWVSFRWQLSHLGFNLTGEYSLLANAKHALGYHSWPVMALALLGLGRLRSPAERLLAVAALFLLVPVALSPANSPRNLSTGLVLLLVLAGTYLPSKTKGWWRRAMAGVLAVGVAVTAVYGAGTVLNLSGSSGWPGSSSVPALREDAAGVEELGDLLATARGTIFCLDYSLAGQLWYYAERPAYSAWGQYPVWGIPRFDAATIVSLRYLPVELVSSRLREGFGYVEGPRQFTFADQGLRKVVYVWEAQDLGWDHETLLRKLDFLGLLEGSGAN